MSATGNKTETQPFTLNPGDPAFVANPNPVYARGRAEHPVFRHAGLPLVSVFRYDDILEVLRDHATWSSRFPPPPDAAERGLTEEDAPSLLGADPPEHDRLRGLINKAFTPRMVARLEPRIREIARTLMDDALEKRRVDLVEALGYPLPVIVIAELLGIPSEDRKQFKDWSDAVADTLGEGIGGAPLDPEAVRGRIAAVAEMDAYMERLLEERRKRPREDLLTTLLEAEAEGSRLSHAEMLTMLRVVLIAGNETTRNLLGNAAIQLVAHPAEFERLRADLGLLPTAVSEVLRFDSPVQATVRRATRPVDLHGERIGEGESALLWLGSANRDVAHFPDPDRFDIARTPNAHLSFGFGRHFCLGSKLAQLEAVVALDELLSRTRSLTRLDDDPIAYTPSFILRGPKHLRVELTPA